MNARQAKELHLPDLLSKLGFEPVKITKSGRELWYNSPFREEKDASFHTSIGSTGIWIWKDFADKGGTIIDFVMRYKGFSHISDALFFLKGFYAHHNQHTLITSQKSFSFHQQAPIAELEADRQLVFLRSQEIKNQVIINYLKNDRRIPVSLAKRYLLEVFYKNTRNDKEYFAFGMKNQSGGYEIRSASDQIRFKSVLIQRDISVIEGRNNLKEKINVFEGMIDFLSYLVSKDRDFPIHDCLVMHSLSSYQKAVDYIQDNGYKEVHTYLDNDRPGHEYTEKFSMLFGAKHRPQNEIYEGHRDLNEALVAHDKASRFR